MGRLRDPFDHQDDAEPVSFGDLLQRYRLASGISQETLAERARVSMQTISAIERGVTRNPQRKTALELVSALRLPPDKEARLTASLQITPRQRTVIAAIASSGASPSGSPVGKHILNTPGSTSLPVPLTSLIGRDADTTTILKLFHRPEVRLLTLTGPGGAGKTRLALHVATTAIPTIASSAAFVSLAAVRDPAGLALIVGQALGLLDTANQTPEATLIAALRDRDLLLLLDNFEQITAAAPLLVEILAACPALRCLVTSREPLRLSGEFQYPVAPLNVPDTGPIDLDQLGQNPAVTLFVQRAQAAAPSFHLTHTNAAAVVAICQRLDGLPLAIELAAARIKLLSPGALLERLNEPTTRLRLLSDGAVDLPRRQRTLRDTIAWSYDLLPANEQVLFRRLSVFAGGCDLKAAEDVCILPNEPDTDVLTSVASLLDKSLLVRMDAITDDGAPRLTMLETIREYGREILAATGELDEMQHRHAASATQVAQDAMSQLTGPHQRTWIARLEREHDNLRAALHWTASNGEIELGLALAGALWRFWYIGGYPTEGRRWLGRLLIATPRPGSKPVAPATRALALNGAGVLAYLQDDYTVATDYLNESLVLRRDLDDQQGVAAVLSNLGNIANNTGDYQRAEGLLEQALSIHRQNGYSWGIAACLNNLGEIARRRGDLQRAKDLNVESLSLRRQLDDQWGIALSLYNLGAIALLNDDLEGAAALLHECRSVRENIGDRHGLAPVLTGLGDVARQQGETTVARELYQRSVALASELGDKAGLAECLEKLAGVLCTTAEDNREQVTQATHIFGAAALLRQDIDLPIAPSDWDMYQHDIALAETILGDADYKAAWTRGQHSTIAQLMAETTQ